MATEQDSIAPLSPNSTFREAEQNFFDGIFILPNLLPSLPGGVHQAVRPGECSGAERPDSAG